MNGTRAIDSIVVGRRHRKDLGDVASLAASISNVGLLHPIVVRPDGVLIAGERRIAACRALGWTEIPATEVDLAEIVRGEMAENMHRKDFLPSEIDAIRRAIEPPERAAAKARMSEGGKGRKVSGPSDARDRIGAFAGVSGRTVEKIAAVCAAAEAEPEKYRHLLARMDLTGKVNGPFLRLMVTRQAESIRAQPPPLPDGRWRVGVCDVPWPSEPDDPDPSGRGRAYWTFPTMSLEAMRKLDVGSRLANDAALWFWTTNFHMRFAFQILEAWGFRHTPTIVTWGKDHSGRGTLLRGQTEHAIMGVRGKPPITTLTGQSTLLLAPTLKPPAMKPPAFYDMVERLCPASGYLDIFSRYRHDERWTCWGDEAPGGVERSYERPEIPEPPGQAARLASGHR